MVGSIIGSIYQLTSPWVVSGTSTIAGSVFVTGSINISTVVLPVSGIVNQGGTWSVGITTNPVPISGQTFILNRTSILSDVYTASSGVTTILSGNTIPNSFALVLKALSINSDYIGIGSKTTLFAHSGLRLYPNDIIKINVDNSNRLAFVTRVTADGIEVFTEL